MKSFRSVLFCALSAPAAIFAGLAYDGSSTIGEGAMPELSKAFTTASKVSFDQIGISGSGKGFEAVMKGTVDIAGMSRPIKAEEKKLKPYYQIIGYDAISVCVNNKNAITGLTSSQLKSIFTGKITNWKEVGGADGVIEVVTEVKTGKRATIEAFKELALENAEYGVSKEIDKPVDCIAYVEKHPAAITFASSSQVGSNVKPLLIDDAAPTKKNVQSGAYLISRPLLLVAKAIPTGTIKAFFDFVLSAEGQKIMGIKFVPVK